MKCPQCHREIPDDAKGCIHCWKDLQKPQQPLSPSPKAAQIETALDKLDNPNGVLLPDNAKALLSLPLTDFKKIHDHSCSLWYGGVACYFIAGGTLALHLFWLVSVLINEPSLPPIPLSYCILLLFLAFSLASVASAGYLLRHIRTRAAQIIIRVLSIIAILFASPFLFNLTFIISLPLIIGYVHVLQASEDKRLFATNPLAHRQIRYFWQHIKEQKPIEENEIPPGRTPGKYDKLHTVLSAYCIAFPFILTLLLLIPALSAARDASIRITCQSNLKSLGQNLQRYQNEHSAYPQSIDEIQTNPPLTCPSAPKGESYEFAPDFPPKDSSLEPDKIPVIKCKHHSSSIFILMGDGHLSFESKPDK